MESNPITKLETRSGAPGFYRLNAAAHMVGISPEMLRQAIEAGQAPVRCIVLGKREIPHVHARDLLAWIGSGAK